MPAAGVPVRLPPQSFRGLHRRLAAPFVAGLAGGARPLARARPWRDPHTVNGTCLVGALTFDDMRAGLERRTELAPVGARPELTA
jgi:hypothetical protein